MTTFGVGGQARYFVEAASEDDIVAAAAWARERGLPLFVLGGGSNLLVADEGFDGLVLHVGLRGFDVAEDGDQAIVKVAAGEDWEHCVRRCTEAGYPGLECLAGIPGTVGGTPVQNVGAYGQEVASVIACVRVFDLVERKFQELTPQECGFAYRRSRFNTVDRGRFMVTRVDYRLTRGGAPTIRYAELKAGDSEGARRGRVGSRGPCGSCGDGSWVAPSEGHAAGGGRCGLPQRGELLQESSGERGTRAADCGSEREDAAEFSCGAGASEDSGGVAD